jgi:hypothetical protein
MEVEAAIRKENKEQQTVLLPIRLDDSVMNARQNWASIIRDRHIEDFKQWESPVDYRIALNRVLRTLEVAPPSTPEANSPLRIRILETPLTAQNLVTIISAITELSTKYWLIAKGRFADLIEYTQTHNGRFAEEANILVTRITYNSPFNMDWKVDLSVPSVADALVTTIDGISQRRERLEKAKLENRSKALEMKKAEQKTKHENQMALLEQEQQRLQLEQQRLEMLEKQLEVQKKGIEYALEIAEKVVDTLHPGADPATRAMEIQALLPNLIQLQNGKGLQLVLPAPLESPK